MLALTLHQPWASAIAIGLKRFETRSWAPPFERLSELAVHAGKQKTVDGRRVFERFAEQFVAAGYSSFASLPFGSVVAVAELASVHETEFLMVHPVGRALLQRESLSTTVEIALGNFDPGRVAWLLRGVRRLPEPIEARGYQKLWRWDAAGELRRTA